jgi:hypothetical protein
MWLLGVFTSRLDLHSEQCHGHTACIGSTTSFGRNLRECWVVHYQVDERICVQPAGVYIVGTTTPASGTASSRGTTNVILFAAVFTGRLHRRLRSLHCALRPVESAWEPFRAGRVPRTWLVLPEGDRSCWPDPARQCRHTRGRRLGARGLGEARARAQGPRGGRPLFCPTGARSPSSSSHSPPCRPHLRHCHRFVPSAPRTESAGCTDFAEFVSSALVDVVKPGVVAPSRLAALPSPHHLRRIQRPGLPRTEKQRFGSLICVKWGFYAQKGARNLFNRCEGSPTMHVQRALK